MKFRLEELQLKKGLSNGELGEKISVSDQQISNYKSGERKPTFEGLFKLAKALDCEIHELFETSEDFEHYYKKGKWHGIRKKK